MTWAAGFIGPFAACIVGLTAVTIDTTTSVARRDVHSILKMISQENCNRGLIMPYMLYDILEFPSVTEYKLDAFTIFLTSGQPIPDVIFDGILKALPKSSMVASYGTTETYVISCQFHDVTPDVKADQMGTIGYPFPGFEVRITDDNDQLVPDFGYLTEKGYLVFTSKSCGMIKRGTVLIAPGSIENVILDHPVISKVIVVGVPDPRLYEELCACVVLHPGESTTERDIIDYCNEKFTEQTLDGLSSTPKFVIIMEDFPKLPNGKPDKISLGKLAANKCFT
ncbi:unnamed protein product [Owenia fusiformis]|uniref:Uncharacterized protein n=1 Tax=Owenia fusiformis TaxID=6347 RepID=A0A8J1U3Z5_OWEFU|nr:unnamed protein product [Owenia fusiformis]